MCTKVFDWSLAGHPVRISLLFPLTRYKLKPLPVPAKGVTYDFGVSPELLARGKVILGSENTDPYVEYRCLISVSGRYLLRYGASVFHAAAFRWRDQAWLLAAPSGTGKTTQFLNWQRLFPGEIQMISGDMPILESLEDGSILVHPSSWNGKENFHGAPAAPLGGLVFLEQGSVDRMLPFPPREAVLPLLRQFMVLPETEQEALQLASLMEKLLLAAPCRKFVNRGGDDSTVLLRETFSIFLEMGADEV